MFFASDNSGPAHPKVMDAMMRQRISIMADPEMDRVRTMVRDLFEAPEAAVYLLHRHRKLDRFGNLTQPWETIFCTKLSHINERM
jgi:threonine aldolase